MMHELRTADGPCSEHKDCTATTFSNDLGVIGVRHLHQWLDKPGLHEDLGRDPEHLVFGAINVGVLLEYDPETGAAVFDAERVVLTGSAEHHQVDPASRLNSAYPIADDHRRPKDKTGNHPKITVA